MLLTGCVQVPVFVSDDHALVKSNYPIVKLNQSAIAPSYRLDIPAGATTVDIVYRTYRYDYHCTFEWAAAAGSVYEVTDQDNKYPLTLYRWKRTNSLWAARLEPTDPQHCDPVRPN